jgi:hypothetical protein
MYSAPARRRVTSWSVRLVVAAYVLAAALLPLAHHDIACHLKSATHCSTCIIGSAGDLASDETPLRSTALDAAGWTAAESHAALASASTTATTGRAPPSLL